MWSDTISWGMGAGDSGVVDRLQKRFRREKVKISAVHPSDINSLLDSLDLLEPVQNGEINCANCDKTVSVDNFGKIYGDGEEIKFTCGRWDCFYGGSMGKSGDDSGDGDNGAGNVVDITEEIASEDEILDSMNSEQTAPEEDDEVVA